MSAMVPMSTDQLRSIASYVKDTQPIIEKQAKFDKALADRVTGVVDVMVQHGCVHPHLKEAKVRELVAEPTKLMDELEKLASKVQVASVGGPVAHIKEASAQGADGKQSASQVFLNTLTGG